MNRHEDNASRICGILDMVPGDQGYAVPRAVQNEHLNEEYTIYDELDMMAILYVRCVRPGEYEIEWRNV